MESKRVMILLITMMVMGNFLVQIEAQCSPSHPFLSCFPGCLLSCAIEKGFQHAYMCPFTCVMKCIAPPSPPQSPTPPSQMVSSNEMVHTDYYCKLGCATQHCVSLSSLRNPNVEKVADCVDSCSDKCSTKN